MKKKYKYIENLETGESTRKRSFRQESRLAKLLNGHTTINSGATFGQNDVITDFCEVEAKTTKHESYKLNLSDWIILRKKCASNKIPILVIDFENTRDSLAVLPYDDLAMLIELSNNE